MSKTRHIMVILLKTFSAFAGDELLNSNGAFINILTGETISNEPVFARAFESLGRILEV